MGQIDFQQVDLHSDRLRFILQDALILLAPVILMLIGTLVLE